MLSEKPIMATHLFADVDGRIRQINYTKDRKLSYYTDAVGRCYKAPHRETWINIKNLDQAIKEGLKPKSKIRKNIVLLWDPKVAKSKAAQEKKEAKSKSPPKKAAKSKSPPKKAAKSKSPPKKAAKSKSPPKKSAKSKSPPKKAAKSKSPPKKAAKSKSPDKFKTASKKALPKKDVPKLYVYDDDKFKIVKPEKLVFKKNNKNVPVGKMKTYYFDKNPNKL